MDYYEELGIAPDASEEEIRRAHRRMVKLLHPDQHTDEGLKQLGEVQMRRLNSIVGVLLDPETRREYDEELRGVIPYYQGAWPGQRRQRRRPSWPWWIASTAAAIALTIIVVLFWANNLGSSFGNHSPTYIPADNRDAPSSAAEVTPPPPATSTAATAPPASSAPAAGIASPTPAAPPPMRTEANNIPPYEKPLTPTPPKASSAPPTSAKPTAKADIPTVVRAPLPSKTVAKVPGPRANIVAQQTVKPVAHPNLAPHKTLVLPRTALVAQAHPAATHVDIPPPPGVSITNSSHLEAAAVPIATLPATPLRPPTEAAPTPTKTISYSSVAKSLSTDSLEGEWVYAPTEPEKKKAGFYPPEYIDLKLFSNDGRLRGQYRARYHVTDKPISPDVEFALSPDGEANKFTWQAANGTRGTFKISSIEPNAIRIEWRTTVFGRQAALTAGSATLVKRSQ